MSLLVTGVEVVGAVVMFIPPLIVVLWQLVSHGVAGLCKSCHDPHTGLWA
jgi:hypothetical protein